MFVIFYKNVLQTSGLLCKGFPVMPGVVALFPVLSGSHSGWLLPFEIQVQRLLG